MVSYETLVEAADVLERASKKMNSEQYLDWAKSFRDYAVLVKKGSKRKKAFLESFPEDNIRPLIGYSEFLMGEKNLESALESAGWRGKLAFEMTMDVHRMVAADKDKYENMPEPEDERERQILQHQRRMSDNSANYTPECNAHTLLYVAGGDVMSRLEDGLYS